MSKKRNKNKKGRPADVMTVQTKYTWLPAAVLIAAGILIFYPPYFRGLFFPKEMFITHVITALVFIGVWGKKIINRDYTFLKTPLDLAILAYAGAYLLSMLGSVDDGEALYGFLKALNYFMIYWIISEIVKTYRDYKNILNILLASAAGVAMIGVLASWGYCSYPDAFDGRVIASTLQYSNAAGLYWGVMALIAITLWTGTSKICWKFLYAGITYLLLLVTLATFSKGAWLIIVIGAVLLLLVMPRQFRLKAASSLGLSILASLIAASGFMPAILNGNTGKAIVFFLIGLVFSLLGPMLLETILRINKLDKKWISLAAGILLILIIAGSYGVIADKGNDLSDKISGEISKLSDTSSTSFTSRLDFARWGMAMIEDHPVIGTGAGGWNALYHQYADRIVWSAELHNGFLQTWVEAGTLGIMAFISIWILFFISIYKIHQENKDMEPEQQEKLIIIRGTVVAAVCMGLHSFMDFDLSLPAVSILLWTLFALINSAGQMENFTRKHIIPNIPFLNVAAASLAALLLLACGSSFALADNYASKGKAAIDRMQEADKLGKQMEQLSVAEKYYKQAAIWDSYNCMHHARLAEIYAVIYGQMKNQNLELAQKYSGMAYQEMAKVDQIAPFNIKARGLLYNISAILGDVDEGIKQAQAVITANPWDINAYNAAMNALQAGMETNLGKDNSKAQIYAQELLLLDEQTSQQREKLADHEKDKFNLSYDSLVAVGKAQYALGDYEEAVSGLEVLAGNMLAMEFADPYFENTAFENENWRVAVVEDEEAINGRCLEITSKQNINGWQTVLSLASSMPVIAGEDYVTEVRYKVISCSSIPEGEQGPRLRIWSKLYGDEESQSTSFIFHKGQKNIGDESTWQVSNQVLTHNFSFNERSFRLGTGSVAEGGKFRIDYVKFYPSESLNLPDNMQKASIWYAAALYQLGEKEASVKIKDEFIDNNTLMELYDKLVMGNEL